MKIVVCVKQVPDTWSEKKLDPASKTLDRDSVDGVMNELDEYAVEEALKIAEATGGEVTVLSMGPSQSNETIRKALSMGANAGIHIQDDGLAGSDAIATSLAIAKVIEGRGVDLILFGSESTDARMSVIPAMVAERLGLPQLTFANKVNAPGDGTVTAHRLTDYGYDVVEASTPAVVSVVEKINEPRYPSFKGIMAAKSKPVDQVTIADLGIDAASVGWAGAGQEIVEIAQAEAREAGTIIEDDGEAFAQVVKFLDDLKVV